MTTPHINAFPNQAQQDYLNTLIDFKPLITAALSGDMVLKVTPATASPKVADMVAAAVEYDVHIRLETAAGVLHDWYNGEVLLAIASDDSTGAASIDPVAGEHKMVKGEMDVKVTLDNKTWTAGKKATLTVSVPATAGTGILGWALASKTFVATVAAA